MLRANSAKQIDTLKFEVLILVIVDVTRESKQ